MNWITLKMLAIQLFCNALSAWVMSVNVYVFGMELPVASIYVLGNYSKSCIFEKIIKQYPDNISHVFA